jgi:KDO2-lipid IV(A) lauroyltransferase
MNEISPVMSSRPPAFWKALSVQKIKNYLICLFIRGLVLFAAVLPAWLALRLGGALGAFFAVVVPRERARAEAHLAIAFPEWTAAQRRALARRVFVCLGQTGLEFLKMNSQSARAIAASVEAVEGREHMEAALQRGHGVVCLTGHIGNWEVLPIFTNHQGWRSAVVAQKLYDPRLDELLNGFRTRRGVQVIQRGNVTSAIIRSLRANMLLGILNDQDTNVDSRWAPFFGQLAKTPVGILRLVRRTQAAVVPVFIARQPSGKNRVYIYPALELPKTGDEEADLHAGAALCNAALENFLRRFPEQWVWFHARWKSKPPA